MVGSMYAAISGLRAHQQKMNVIGNNIANVNTYGYKRQRTTFSESMYSSMRVSTAGTATAGGTNASQIGYGCNVGTIDMNMRTGTYAVTDDPMDLMIDGDGFLLVGDIVADPAGYPAKDSAMLAGGLSLTRVGNLSFDNNGYLVDGKGNVVYGFRWEGDANTGKYNPERLQPIRIPDVDGNIDADITKKRMALSGISISANGEVTALSDQKKPVKLGCIALGYVDNPNGLTHTEGPYYQAGGNSGALRPGTCNGTVTDANAGAGQGDGLVNFASKMVTGTLEMSNVDISSEFADLITTQRGFQANTKIITVTDEMLSDLVAMKR